MEGGRVLISREQARQLFEEYSAYVYRAALLLTSSRALADDVVQETFLRAFKSFSSYNPAKPIEPWLYKIAMNAARNLMRKEKWLTFVGQVPDSEFVENPENPLVKQEEIDTLHREIRKLPFKSREVLILHYYSELQLNDIADVLGIPQGTCKSRLHTALTILRRTLPDKKYFEDLQGGY